MYARTRLEPQNSTSLSRNLDPPHFRLRGLTNVGIGSRRKHRRHHRSCVGGKRRMPPHFMRNPMHPTLLGPDLHAMRSEICRNKRRRSSRSKRSAPEPPHRTEARNDLYQDHNGDRTFVFSISLPLAWHMRTFCNPIKQHGFWSTTGLRPTQDKVVQMVTGPCLQLICHRFPRPIRTIAFQETEN